MNVVKEWIPDNWKTKNAYLNKNNKLSNVTYAEESAYNFLKQRDAMRKFLRFMYRNTIDTKYFKEEEAQKMRDIWWKTDRDCKSNFTQTRPLFKNRTVTEFMKTHNDFGNKFEKLTEDYYYYNFYSADRLNWTLTAE
uniref:PRESAN domain-containing protein n=1 Tax=Caenorhabditis tropicalis TaxID=1561998 RepID=A0A1I7TDE3_9PELO